MRLALAYEYDPYFTLSIARVDPLPHQLEAVYDSFLKLPRIRFLLAVIQAPARPSWPDCLSRSSRSGDSSSTVNPIPQFQIKTVPICGNTRIVLLIRVEESLIYVRPAAASDPVTPDNRAEIDRMYDKRSQFQAAFQSAMEQTWFKNLRWPNPTAHLVACPVLIQEDLTGDFDSDLLSTFQRLAVHLPCYCKELNVVANELRSKNDTTLLPDSHGTACWRSWPISANLEGRSYSTRFP